MWEKGPRNAQASGSRPLQSKQRPARWSRGSTTISLPQRAHSWTLSSPRKEFRLSVLSDHDSRMRARQYHAGT